MAGTAKKQPLKAAFLGLISVALYIALLARQDLINEYVGKGGMFAFLPIATAFLFSFIHGGFTGHFWSLLGVEARKKMEVK